ncbi:ATP/GTP-binding protein [uncultured Pedobacter sp.]|uniref:AAA family ATPase n=1 Tax=uncultured Pedobacter sp. TaxID=246139 RepID=UPI002606DF54|nr:ATP-binding protein [uncultured Pedobacter sp.]
MIVDFSVQNFRSVNELQTLSFVATGLKSAKDLAHVDVNNINVYGETGLFNTVGIYGANASGKSNIVKALDYFIKVMVSQPSSVSNLQSLAQPFLFQENADSTESYFQLTLILGETKYRYGLTVKKNAKADDTGQKGEVVTNEWLFANKEKNMGPLFVREGKVLTKNHLKNKAKIPVEMPYEHSLFLTHAAAFDTEGDCKKLTDYLRGFFVSDYDIRHDKFRWMSIRQLENNDGAKERFRSLLASFNLKYNDIVLDKDAEIDYSKIFPQDKVSLIKDFRTGEKVNSVSLNLKLNESAGTQKMFDLAGLLLLAFSLKSAAFIILDEIDSNFHPALLIKLIGLFNDPEVNRSKSQLLFTSHDTNLMSPVIMRRDQFYFTEKKEDHSSRLYSLSDLKGIRNDADFAKQYLAGYYGALPVLDGYCTNSDNDA